MDNPPLRSRSRAKGSHLVIRERGPLARCGRDAKDVSGECTNNSLSLEQDYVSGKMQTKKGAHELRCADAM